MTNQEEVYCTMTNQEKVLQAFAADTKVRPSIMQLIEDGHFRASDVLEAAAYDKIILHSPKFIRRLERRARNER